jgi:hypothetical protein
VSQDRHEVFLTFATFDKDYVEYVSGNLDAEVGSSEEIKPRAISADERIWPIRHDEQVSYEMLGILCPGIYPSGVRGDGWGRRHGARVAGVRKSMKLSRASLRYGKTVRS